MTATLPPDVEFAASNGLMVSTDARGAVSIEWGSPRGGGWTSHDPDETLALQEFFQQHAPAVNSSATPSNGPWHVQLVEDDEYVRVKYCDDDPVPFDVEFDIVDLDSLISQLAAVRDSLTAGGQ